VPLEHSLTGLDRVIANLESIDRRTPEAARESLYEIGEETFDKTQDLVPRDEGTLAESGELVPPRFVSGGRDIELNIRYGAPGSGAEDYAVRQHEDLTLNHPYGGEAKYVERPMAESYQTFRQRIGRKIRQKLGL
jgi:hypothetical protein